MRGFRGSPRARSAPTRYSDPVTRSHALRSAASASPRRSARTGSGSTSPSRPSDAAIARISSGERPRVRRGQAGKDQRRGSRPEFPNKARRVLVGGERDHGDGRTGEIRRLAQVAQHMGDVERHMRAVEHDRHNRVSDREHRLAPSGRRGAPRRAFLRREASRRRSRRKTSRTPSAPSASSAAPASATFSRSIVSWPSTSTQTTLQPRSAAMARTTPPASSCGPSEVTSVSAGLQNAALLAGDGGARAARALRCVRVRYW